MDPENLEAAAAKAAKSGATAAVFVPKGPKTIEELKEYVCTRGFVETSRC